MSSLQELLLQHARTIEQAWGDQITPISDEVRAGADDACRGVLPFWWGPIERIEVGRTNIDWTAKHRQHQEWPAQLHRFRYIDGLTSAFRASKDGRYARAARDYILDWIGQHPHRPSWERKPYDSTLNLCIRVGNSQWAGWIGCLPALMNSEEFDEDTAQAVIESTTAQLNWLAENPAPAINWRIANADALVVCGLRLGFVPEAEAWRRRGVDILNDAFHRQILADGAHLERCPGYHQWMNQVGHRFWQLARVQPSLGLAISAQAVAGMYEYSAASTRPNGSYCAINDSQGLRFTEKADHTFMTRRNDFRREAGLPDAVPTTSAYFPEAGQAFLRTDWSPGATYVTFDATRWGGAHCHLARNSIQIHAYGKTLLADPGWLTYEGSDPAAAHGKGTQAHNTLTLAGCNQTPTNPSITQYAHAPGYDLMRSDYEGGYFRSEFHWGFREGMADGHWGSHCRVMLFVHDLGVVVIDSMYREPRGKEESEGPPVEANWQFIEGPFKLDAEHRRAFTAHESGNLQMLMPLMPEGSRAELYEGQRQPFRAWLPTDHGMVPAPQVCVTTPAMKGRYSDFVWLFLPFEGATPPEVRCLAQTPATKVPGRCTLIHEDGRVDVFLWNYRLDLMLGSIELASLLKGLPLTAAPRCLHSSAPARVETDAGMLHVRLTPDGRVARVAAIQGTHLRPLTPTALAAPGIVVAEG